MGKLDLKDSSRANQLDCIISYFFKLYLILYACVKRFKKILELNRTAGAAHAHCRGNNGTANLGPASGILPPRCVNRRVTGRVNRRVTGCSLVSLPWRIGVKVFDIKG